MELATPVELLSENNSLHPSRRARPLHHGSVWELESLKNERNSDDPFAADQADFDRVPVLCLGENGHRGRIEEIRPLRDDIRLA